MADAREDIIRECAARIAAEMEFIARNGMNGTEPPAITAINRAKIEIIFEEMQQRILNRREEEIADYMHAHQIMELNEMARQELESQVQARDRFLTKLRDIANRKDTTLADLAGAIRFIEEEKKGRSWEATIQEFETINTPFNTTKKEMRELLDLYYRAATAAADRAAQQIKKNGFPTLCYIMTFLCVIPEGCRNAVVAYLQRTPLGPLASMSVSDQACIYWQAKTAGYMYNSAADINIHTAMNTLYGFSINCQNMCYALLFNYNAFVRMAGDAVTRGASTAANNFLVAVGDLLLRAASKASDYFKLVDVPLDIVDTGSDTASTASATSAASVAASVATNASSYKFSPDTPLLTVKVVNYETPDINESVVAHYNSANNRREVEEKLSETLRFVDSMRSKAAMGQYDTTSRLASTLSTLRPIQASAYAPAASWSSSQQSPMYADENRLGQIVGNTPLGTPSAASAASGSYGSLLTEANLSNRNFPAASIPDANQLQELMGKGLSRKASKIRKRDDADAAAASGNMVDSDDDDDDDAVVDTVSKDRKVDGPSGGRRRKRKSMRHRKRRSTLKRRRLKRRRTRKGKKRRYTKKRR